MVYYILLLWIFIAGAVCFCPNGKVNFQRNKTLFLFISYIAIIFVLGMRNQTVGVDTKSYYIIFNKVSETPFSEIMKSYYYLNIEIGYIFLMKFVSILGNYYLFQIVVAFIACILFAKFIADNMNNYFLGVILFLGFDIFLLLFNISRQMLAVALIVNCWSYLNHGKKNRALILFILAGLMHTTAWLFMAIYLIYLIRNNRFIIRLLPIIGVVIIFSYKIILDKVASIVPHYANYYGNHKTILEVGLSMVIWILIVSISIVLIITNIRISKYGVTGNIINEKNTLLDWTAETYLYAAFSLFYVASNIIGLSFNYFERLGCYFAPFVMITFERFGMQIKNTIIRRMYYCGLVVCFSIYFILSTKTEQYLYNFFW